MVTKPESTLRLEAADFVLFGRVRVSLREWLPDHGRRSLLEGASGVVSAALGLAGMHVFGWSPLLVGLCLMIVLATEGIGLSVQHRRHAHGTQREFLSPAQAIAWVRAVVGACAWPRWHERHGRIAAALQPRRRQRKPLAADAASSPSVASGAAVRRSAFDRFGDAVIWIVLGLIVMLLGGALLAPLSLAMFGAFDARQWASATVMLAVGSVQAWTVARQRPNPASAPWDDPRYLDLHLSLEQLVFWKHDRRLSALVAVFLLLCLCFMAADAQSRVDGNMAAALARFDSIARPLLTVMLVLSLLLHAALLAAPVHARRLVATLDAFDPSTAMDALVGSAGAGRGRAADVPAMQGPR